MLLSLVRFITDTLHPVHASLLNSNLGFDVGDIESEVQNGDLALIGHNEDTLKIWLIGASGPDDIIVGVVDREIAVGLQFGVITGVRVGIGSPG